MKNETKSKIIKILNKIDELHEAYRQELKEESKFCDGDALLPIKYQLQEKLFTGVTPLVNELEDVLQASLTAATGNQDKEELKKCIELSKFFYTRADAARYFGLVTFRIRDFKAFVEGLVENDGQLHTKATGQSSDAKQGKAASTGSGEADQDKEKGFLPGANQQGRKRADDHKGQ